MGPLWTLPRHGGHRQFPRTKLWEVEATQVKRLEMKPLVSITDHDDIEAATDLRFFEESREMPISVEWTVPYSGTFFHIGIHNIPGDRAREIMRLLHNFTAGQQGPTLRDLFESLARNPQVMIVFNHANWDEKGIGQDATR